MELTLNEFPWFQYKSVIDRQEDRRTDIWTHRWWTGGPVSEPTHACETKLLLFWLVISNCGLMHISSLSRYQMTRFPGINDGLTLFSINWNTRKKEPVRQLRSYVYLAGLSESWWTYLDVCHNNVQNWNHCLQKLMYSKQVSFTCQHFFTEISLWMKTTGNERQMEVVIDRQIDKARDIHLLLAEDEKQGERQMTFIL